MVESVGSESGLDALGVDFVGFGAEEAGVLFKAVGDLAQAGIKSHEKGEANKASAADAASKLAAAIKADAGFVAASARAATSAKNKMAGADTDRLAADAAAATQDRAAASLGEAAAAKRLEAAEAALDAATKKAQSSPKDEYLAACVRAWVATINKTQSKRIAESDDKPAKTEEAETRSWLTRPVIGKVPGWGVAAGGTGVAVGLAVLARHILGR